MTEEQRQRWAGAVVWAREMNGVVGPRSYAVRADVVLAIEEELERLRARVAVLEDEAEQERHRGD